MRLSCLFYIYIHIRQFDFLHFYNDRITVSRFFKHCFLKIYTNMTCIYTNFCVKILKLATNFYILTLTVCILFYTLLCYTK